MKRRSLLIRKRIIKLVVRLTVIFLSAMTLLCVFLLIRLAKSYHASRIVTQSMKAIAHSQINPSAPTYDKKESIALVPDLPFNINWNSLRKVNKDIIAWIYCEGTTIDYPIVQTKDNEFYLSRQFDRTKNASGTLFLYSRNNISAHDENLVVYGHRMKDDSMFGTLPMYAQEFYFCEHPTMYLFTPEMNYTIEIFACRTVTGEKKYFQTFFENRDAFLSYVNKAIKQSYWQTEFNVLPDESIITLVTCSTYKHTKDPRILVHGILKPISNED